MRNTIAFAIIAFSVLIFTTVNVYAQGVAISNSGGSPDPSAGLDIQFNDKGILIPRLTTNERDNNISNAAEGLMIYNTTTKCFEAFISGNWNSVSCPSNCAPPGVAETVYGPSQPCSNVQEIYSINPVNSATTYSWSFPLGWSIVTGQGTNEVVVNTGGLGQNGTISVAANNTCGSGAPAYLPVNVTAVPADAGVISGNAVVCQGQNSVNYSVDPIANSDYYIWNLPDGYYGYSSSSNIDVDFDLYFSASGSINVRGVNYSCGEGSESSLAVTVNMLPEGAGAITVSSPSCQGGSSSAIIDPIANATSYVWVYSGSGASINGNSNSVSIDFSNSATSGYLSVIGLNECGYGYYSSEEFVSVGYASLTTPTAGVHVAGQSQIVWNWNTVPGATGYQWNTSNIYPGNGVHVLSSPSYTQTGLTYNSSYQLYVWAYNDCGVYSSPVSLSAATPNLTSACGTVSFTYGGNAVTYGTVSGQNGTCWLDRNLGASQQATAFDDMAAYGDLFQWGRGADGHQYRTSGTTAVLSNGNSPGHSNFIIAPDDPYDWRSPANNSLWQGVSGINNPCPSGWRIPTSSEMNNERASWSPQNYYGAYANTLKWTAAGSRDVYGNVSGMGSYGGFAWTSTVGGTRSENVQFLEGQANMGLPARGYGFSVRCIKN